MCILLIRNFYKYLRSYHLSYETQAIQRPDPLQDFTSVGGRGANKTQIVYKSGLNFHTIIPYLEILTHRGLLVREVGKIPLYRTTEMGETALGHLRELERLIWDDAAEGETA